MQPGEGGDCRNAQQPGNAPLRLPDAVQRMIHHFNGMPGVLGKYASLVSQGQRSCGALQKPAAQMLLKRRNVLRHSGLAKSQLPRSAGKAFGLGNSQKHARCDIDIHTHSNSE